MTYRNFTRAALAAGAIVFAAGTANALPYDPAPAKAKSETRAERDPDQRICVRSDRTGSSIKRTVCMTRAEWVRTQGVDPSAR